MARGPRKEGSGWLPCAQVWGQGAGCRPPPAPWPGQSRKAHSSAAATALPSRGAFSAQRLYPCRGTFLLGLPGEPDLPAWPVSPQRLAHTQPWPRRLLWPWTTWEAGSLAVSICSFLTLAFLEKSSFREKAICHQAETSGVENSSVSSALSRKCLHPYKQHLAPKSRES